MGPAAEIDVIIPVYRPGERFLELLARLAEQTMPIGTLVLINTEKKDWTEEAQKLIERLSGERNAIGSIQLLHIRREEFDHAATRNLGTELCEAPVFVCMTDDAVPADDRLLERLYGAFFQEKEGEAIVEAAYARQIPREDCRPAEVLTRHFNYPETSFIKGQEDLKRLGIKTYFASDVCCAYRRDIFLMLGGFCEHAIFNEDMIYAHKAVTAGYRIAYCGDAMVIHSHNYSPLQQFHRNFDMGMSQAQHPEVFSGLPSEGEGIRLVKDTAGKLVKQGLYGELPGLILQSGAKYLGYRLGKAYRHLPYGLIHAFSSNKIYVEKHKEELKQ